MGLSEQVLYFLARSMSRGSRRGDGSVATAARARGEYVSHRVERNEHLFRAAEQYGVPIEGRAVLDFGCGNGSSTRGLLDRGASSVIGVDISADNIAYARSHFSAGRVRFVQSEPERIPLEDACVDTIVSYDVLEHVERLDLVLQELHRVLRPAGRALAGTWGWKHPFAHHLFNTMPVPWAHCLWSEKTVVRVCRRVYLAPWFVPAYHDLDAEGKRKPSKYLGDRIPGQLNRLMIRDFERILAASPFRHRMHLLPFRSKWARWTAVLLRAPRLREYVTGYVWLVLAKDS